jgi:hypothetical protein
MEGIHVKDVVVAGPGHPSFGLNCAWYTFGMFSADGSARRFLLVEAENKNAVHMIEAIVQENGTVSATCALVSVSTQQPQIRSSIIESVPFVDFMIDIVASDRWLNSPFLIGLFQQSLSEVDRINADMKIESAIRLYEWEQQVLEAREQLESGEQFETSVECSETMDRLGAGLRGLGFAKHDVQKFVESVKDRTDSMQVLLTEGIKQLNGKL